MGSRPATGGCLCGAVRYEVSGPCLSSVMCYCRSCCRAAGAPAVAWAGFPRLAFRVFKGTLAIHESSPGVLRGFCRGCGTPLTYQKIPAVRNGARDDVHVTTMSLDDPGAYPPEERAYEGERVPWIRAPREGPRLLPHSVRIRFTVSNMRSRPV